MAERLRDELREPEDRSTPAPLLGISLVVLLLVLAGVAWFLAEAVRG